MITKLSLINFRNHKQLYIESKAKYILLSGKNGTGKTSVMESISFFAPGRNLKNCLLNEVLFNPCFKNMNNKTNNVKGDSVKSDFLKNSWQVDILLDNDVKLRCSYNNLNHRKYFSKNDVIFKSFDEIGNQLNIIWLTPQMNDLFTNGAAERRKFIDRIVYSFIKDHGRDAINYNKQIRSRLNILRENQLQVSDKWLDALEQSIADLSIRITMRRALMCNIINMILLNAIPDVFGLVQTDMYGKVDDLSNELLHFFIASEGTKITINDIEKTTNASFIKILECDAIFFEKYNKIKNTVLRCLKEARKKDSIIGQSTYGPHKSDFVVYDSKSGRLAKICSTGEQKSSLISLILSYSFALCSYFESKQTNQEESSCKAIILLDDVLAYLDDTKINILTNFLEILKAQIWISGVNLIDYCNKLQSLKCDYILIDMDNMRTLVDQQKNKECVAE